jgi:putative membrane protein
MMGLNDQDRARVEAAVRAAEQRTSAQFAVVVAHASDAYALYPVLGAALLALVIGDIAALAWPDLGTWWIVAIQAAIFVIADLVLHAKALRFRLVPTKVKCTHAARLARLQFAGLVHDRTKGDVGVMLFVSEAERHVEILVDRGIAARIPETAWQAVVADFVAKVAAGQVAEALIGAVTGCTAILEQHFPPVPGIGGAPELSGTITEI